MSKIYVVMAGAYSDQSVDVVFTDKTNADLYANAYDGWVAESEIDPEVDPHILAGEASWACTLTPTETTVWSASGPTKKTEKPTARKSGNWTNDPYGVVSWIGQAKSQMHVWLWAKTGQEAEEKAAELFRKHLRAAKP